MDISHKNGPRDMFIFELTNFAFIIPLWLWLNLKSILLDTFDENDLFYKDDFIVNVYETVYS